MGKGDFWNVKFELGDITFGGYPVSMARGINNTKRVILLYHSQYRLL
jgi:hypothetical protein